MGPEVIVDLDTGKPLQGVTVAGVFGKGGSFYGSYFHCSAVELAITDAAGRYRFARGIDLYRVLAHKDGYHKVYTATAGERFIPFGMSRQGLPFEDRFEEARELRLLCSESREWSAGREFLALMARDAARSATSDVERIKALDLCRAAVDHGDDGGRVHGMGQRFSFTGLEADRLRITAPDCLTPGLMAAKMNADPGTGFVRKPIPVDDPRFLERAIIRDPAAFVKALSKLNAIGSGCQTGRFADSLPCCVESGGGPAGVPKIMDALDKAGIRYRLTGGSGVCVSSADRDRAVEAATEANAQLRDEL